MSADNVYDKEDPRQLLPELCRLFYRLGWMRGSGGALSIKYGNDIYMTPPGVQKERLQPDELFVTNLIGEELDGSPKKKNNGLQRSQLAPVMMMAYQKRDAGAVFHTHSPAATFVSILYPGKEFRITHQQMIKRVSGRYDQELIVPIIQNSDEESKIIGRMEEAIDAYPETNAVIVRRHGIYVWGDSWQKTKLLCESYDCLFEMAIRMKQFGMDPAKIPEEEEVN